MNTPPPEYVAEVERMARVLVAASMVMTLRFAMPPRETMLVARLEVLWPRLARDDATRRLLPALMNACPRGPTVFMLRVALDLAGIRWDELSLSELGIDLPKA